MDTAKENDTKRLKAWKDRVQVRGVLFLPHFTWPLSLLQGKNMNKPLGHVEIVVKFKDEALPRSAVNPREQKSMIGKRYLWIQAHWCYLLLVSVPPTTQLDVILWEVPAHAWPEIRDRIRSRSHFKTESPSETLSLSDPKLQVAYCCLS